MCQHSFQTSPASSPSATKTLPFHSVMKHRSNPLVLLLLVVTAIMLLFAIMHTYPTDSLNQHYVNPDRLQLDLISQRQDPKPVSPVRDLADLPMIYPITPTYGRSAQIADLTRLSQTLMLVPNIHWIICEDSWTPNRLLQLFLKDLKLNFTLILTPMPAKYRRLKKQPKGCTARNAGLKWLTDSNKDGVLYFMDDDNTYDIRVFEEMRWTQRVSMWPVGLVTELAVSSPILKNGQLLGWYDGYMIKRKFAIDMAGFATNVQFMIKVGGVEMPYMHGLEEDGYLRALKIGYGDIEFKADGCTKIYVWHTRTQWSSRGSPMIINSHYDGTNLRKLQSRIMLSSRQNWKINSSYEAWLIKEQFSIHN